MTLVHRRVPLHHRAAMIKVEPTGEPPDESVKTILAIMRFCAVLGVDGNSGRLFYVLSDTLRIRTRSFQGNQNQKFQFSRRNFSVIYLGVFFGLRRDSVESFQPFGLMRSEKIPSGGNFGSSRIVLLEALVTDQTSFLFYHKEK